MKIILSKKEIEEIFHTALCNGLSEFNYYGISLEYNEKDYAVAKSKLKLIKDNDIICYEDVLVEILLNGNSLCVKDLENDDCNSEIYISDLYERIGLVNPSIILEFLDGNDDATSADIVLQTIFFKEVIFA